MPLELTDFIRMKYIREAKMQSDTVRCMKHLISHAGMLQFAVLPQFVPYYTRV